MDSNFFEILRSKKRKSFPNSAQYLFPFDDDQKQQSSSSEHDQSDERRKYDIEVNNSVTRYLRLLQKAKGIESPCLVMWILYDVPFVREIFLLLKSQDEIKIRVNM